MRAAMRAATSLLVGTAIFVGLPLLGWGVRSIPGFFDESARATYVIVAVVLQVVVVSAMPSAGRTRAATKTIVARQRAALALIQILSLAVVIVAPFCDRRGILTLGDATVLRWVGVALFPLGMLAMQWAEAYLGRFFTVNAAIQEGHTLVTSGPYRYLRHPRYLGIVVFFAGISLVFRAGSGLLMLAALAAVLAWRIHDEEAMMRAEFGAEWDAYAGRTWRVIPLVY